MQGCLNEVKEELGTKGPESTDKIEKINGNLEKLDKVQTKEELIESEYLNKIRRFLEEIINPDSSISKLIRGEIKHGFSIAQDLGQKYNNIAEWYGIPVIPKVLLKNHV
ncbi:hypothetical protein [Oceanobacillus sp. CFH 90083]|uniref:hypothetical protein n=1 Tax=Oceanobacillus sp. CFH 90083 TaxID=2592336 RepID=UPI00128E2A6F|nr:hypothetical protein [Oceanobacillus sp. CFH 90083]